jgi:anti-sigma-K factor RskA
VSPTDLPDHDCGADVAAYALGALEPDEANAFAVHLKTCAVCRDELAAFRGVVDVLPLSAPAHRAPRSLRRRVLREVRSPRRDPQGAGANRPRTWRLPASRLGPALAGAAAAVVLLIAVLGGFSGSAAPVRTIHAQVTGPGEANLRLSSGHNELVVSHLPPPPAGEIYEVWVRHGQSSPVPSGLFSVTSSGSGDVDVPGDLRGVTRVMVTPEPSGGSPHPTHAPIISASI